MFLEVLLLAECLAADSAGEGFLSGVGAHVFLEVLAPFEGPPTGGTDVLSLEPPPPPEAFILVRTHRRQVGRRGVLRHLEKTRAVGGFEKYILN